jgi:L-ascorbate metabolism protein UlaG (beta-lactamase superfamily)
MRIMTTVYTAPALLAVALLLAPAAAARAQTAAPVRPAAPQPAGASAGAVPPRAPRPNGAIGDNDPKPDFVSSARRLFTAPELPDAPDEWIDRSLRWVDAILDAFKPAIVEHPVRRAALTRLDDILHIPSAPEKALVQRYYRSRIERAVDEIERTKVTSGMRIWKLYNHGFLVRTPTVSFAFDLVPGVEKIDGFSIPQDLLARLAAQADALFISHWHNDHANPAAARLFIAQGKPVVVPERLWKDKPELSELSKALTYLERSTTKTHELRVRGGEQRLQVVVYPGHQGPSVLVNVPLVITPEGFSVIHTGDQWNADAPGSDFDWLAQIGRDHEVDVFLPNCWTNGLARMARGINPALIVTGHENEMGHTVPHREDYTQTYNRLFDIPYPSAVMAWGESIHYERVHHD